MCLLLFSSSLGYAHFGQRGIDQTTTYTHTTSQDRFPFLTRRVTFHLPRCRRCQTVAQWRLRRHRWRRRKPGAASSGAVESSLLSSPPATRRSVAAVASVQENGAVFSVQLSVPHGEREYLSAYVVCMHNNQERRLLHLGPPFY